MEIKEFFKSKWAIFAFNIFGMAFCSAAGAAFAVTEEYGASAFCFLASMCGSLTAASVLRQIVEGKRK